MTKFISNTIINFKSFIQIFREDFLCGIVSRYYANMQKPDCEVDCKQIFLVYYLVFKFNIVQVSINRLSTPSFPRLMKSVCTKVKSKKLLKS